MQACPRPCTLLGTLHDVYTGAGWLWSRLRGPCRRSQAGGPMQCGRAAAEGLRMHTVILSARRVCSWAYHCSRRPQVQSALTAGLERRLAALLAVLPAHHYKFHMNAPTTIDASLLAPPLLLPPPALQRLSMCSSPFTGLPVVKLICKLPAAQLRARLQDGPRQQGQA